MGDSYIDYKSPFHPTITDKGVVVSQNFESSAIGVQILNAGGNAVDAAVAVGFSLAITLPRAGNLGVVFMLIYLEDSKKYFLLTIEVVNLKMQIFNSSLAHKIHQV